MTQTPAICEIPLQAGGTCGIPPIGRCATCGLAFCRSHQAWEGQTFYIDQCAPCFAKTPAQLALAEYVRYQAEIQASKQYFASGAARTDLLACGVEPVDIYWFSTRWKKKKGFFGLRDHFAKVVTPLGHGWILGTFQWQYYVQNYDSLNTSEVDVLTALLEDPQSLPDELARKVVTDWKNGGLIPVKPCSKGYELIEMNGASFEQSSWGRSEDKWIAAEKRVKQLATP